ncbi:MAG: SulP family inorganic anion transporter [Phycisphaerales bacterium JB054]
MNAWIERYTPKLVICLREGYTKRRFFGDLAAGLTVAVIAMPLAMALGIASIPQNVADELASIHPWLTPPAMGLFTAVIAGFIISALGGSRVQIGGPTAAFIPIVFGIAAAYGYEGLATATVMAGVIVILMGVFRFGQFIKFIPYPVTTGFTAGIAVTIFASQLKDFFGLTILTDGGDPATIPAEFVPKLHLLFDHMGTISWHATGVGVGSLAVLILLRRVLPRVPGAIVAVVLSAGVVSLMGWSSTTEVFDGVHARPLVETIGTRFSGIPNNLPAPHMPQFSLALVRDLIPSALTIAILCSIESLLSAVVADGMTGYRHRSDQELVAQGVANLASAAFFGLPATGAIARTAANIKNGGTTPVAGMLHAVIILAFMLALAPLAKAIPLPMLAALLIMVAWNICEVDHFRSLLRAPKPDVLVLLATFGLTVFTDLTIGVGVGMVLAAFLFMKRMSEVSNIAGLREGIREGQETEEFDPKDPGVIREKDVPPGVEVYEINGPFFFGVADKLGDTLRQLSRPPRVFILRMRYVPHVDATGLHALEEFHDKCKRQGTTLLLGGVHAQPLFEMTKLGILESIGVENLFESLDEALGRAREIVADGAAAPA